MVITPVGGMPVDAMPDDGMPPNEVTSSENGSDSIQDPQDTSGGASMASEQLTTEPPQGPQSEGSGDQSAPQDGVTDPPLASRTTATLTEPNVVGEYQVEQRFAYLWITNCFKGVISKKILPSTTNMLDISTKPNTSVFTILIPVKQIKL